MSLEWLGTKDHVHQRGRLTVKQGENHFKGFGTTRFVSHQPVIPAAEIFHFPEEEENDYIPAAAAAVAAAGSTGGHTGVTAPPSRFAGKVAALLAFDGDDENDDAGINEPKEELKKDEPKRPLRPLPDVLPNAAECATHLELLQVFWVKRQEILTSEKFDRCMNIVPKRVTKVGKKGDTKTLKDDTLWSRRQVKWPRYLDFAVVRFLAWKEWINTKPDGVAEKNGRLVLRWVPPLDVLMVWHALMLNPKTYFEHCRDEKIFKIRLNWADVHDAISNRTWTYEPPGPGDHSFERNVDLPTDLPRTLEEWFATGTTPRDRKYLDDENFTLHNIGKLNAKIDSNRSLSVIQQGIDLIDKYERLFAVWQERFPFELKGAVIRQSVFVEKMNGLLWIRSPALDGTLRRAIDRYTKFLKILKDHPGNMIVPTLDIDLAWHTHQCQGMGYRQSMIKRVGRFINHDDTVAPFALGDGFAWSRKIWRVNFGKEYKMCGCWDCEMLISELEAAMKPREKVDMERLAREAKELEIAMKAPGCINREQLARQAKELEAAMKAPGEIDMEHLARKAEEKVRFHRAVELAIRNKRPLPVDIYM